MDKNQTLALQLWLESANLWNDFKPMSDRELCEVLEREGIVVGKSTIDRWRKKFDFEAHLQTKISVSMVEDQGTRDLISKSASDAVVQKTIVDLDRNETLAGMAYSILEAKAEVILKKYEDTKSISDNDAKIALSIAQLTTGRTDRMLDRAAMLDAAKLVSKDDLLDQFNNIDVEIEEE